MSLRNSTAILLLLAGWALAAGETTEIKVDQVGYLTSAPKVALVASKSSASAFTVRRASDGGVAFNGTLSAATDDPDSGDRVQAADFSKLTTAGKYYVEVADVGRSWEFTIGPEVYARAWYLAMRSYYGQRCGTEVNLGSEFPGLRHEVCHLEGAWHASSGKSGVHASKAGWHDAGDYGRYVVNSGLTTGTLLRTWEMFAPAVRNVKLKLPESGNGTPDILNEIRWNLEWMLSMQDEDGGVWHKQTSERFSGFVMPEKDTLVSYVVGSGTEPFKTSCATGDLAAVMAIAARAYKPFDAAFAARSRRAAEKAWTWLVKFPNARFTTRRVWPPATTAMAIAATKRSGQRRNFGALPASPLTASISWRTTRNSRARFARRGRNRGPTWPMSRCGRTSWAEGRMRKPQRRSGKHR
jgi:endoglucanase